MNTDTNATMEAKHERRKARRASLFNKRLMRMAAKQSLIMLKPWVMARNPVMFITEIGAALTTLVLLLDLLHHRAAIAYTLAVAVILWLTVLFANFAEALAEARGKAQADTLKQTRRKTLAFLLVTGALWPIGRYFNVELPIPTLIALLVCLIPTTIGALLAAIGLAGMDRALSANVLAKSGKAVELAGDLDTLLLDKTGTITMGNRRATAYFPLPGVTAAQLAEAAIWASLGDQTPEGKSIVQLGIEKLGAKAPRETPGGRLLAFSAQSRLSGLDLPDGRTWRKGAADAIRSYLRGRNASIPDTLQGLVDGVARQGSTPIVVAEGQGALGVIALADVLKPGIRDRFERLRAMGLRVVMVTGDNPLTAAAIAKQAGVDDFIAEATPEDKLAYIRQEQRRGRLIAMMGDGTNDAPALAQADIGVAMNSGTQAAKEAGNMVDLDSDPTKLIEIIEIGKQLLITRGAMTTFSIANDVAKYFAIIPAMFMLAMPQLAALNIMRLATPQSAILSALIFNALVIPLLIPIAIKGVTYRPMGADSLPRRNLLIYGLGGIIAPFVGIKLIDVVLRLTAIA
jgi:K+-transporting ATPase ATPase B chain